MRLNRLRFFMAGLAACCLLATYPSGATAQATDTDTDGMPDAWETFFGLNPNSAADATGDPDGDGLTNLQEFQAGRHPVGRFARFFAEGSTGYFETSLAVLNLSTTDTAHVSIALLNESGEVTPHQITLAPRARQSVSLNTVLGNAGAVSIIVESDVAIAADRAMTWGPSGVGLSLDSGAPAPATTWYFAEGATGPFLLYYLFENPGATPATVTVRYLREGNTPISRTRTLPPHSRTTVFVNEDDPGVAAASLGAVVTSDLPILAERAMYMQANGTFAGGSASSGSPALSTQWYFGEGATGPFFHAFLSLLNPGLVPATATVTYHLSDGSTVAKAYTVPAEARRTVYFNGEAEADATLAALATGPVWFTVSSTQPIVGERAMWWSTWPWYEGHAAAGSTISDVAWGVAEGRDGGPDNDQTYVLVGNTTSTAGQVRVSLIPDTGAPQTRDLTIAGGARLTINVGSLFGLTGANRFSVSVESLGASPVPLAVDYARYRSVNGVPFSGGGAAPAVPLLPGDPAPSVIATTPANGATGASNTNNLVVTFNEPVNAAAGAFTLACPTGTPIALTVVTASPASQFTLDPAVALPALTTCTLTVEASAITDVDADDPPDVMTADAIITFTTALDDNPTVSSTTPASGATQAGPAANLTITFSEPVDVTGNWFQIVCATSGARGVADTVVTGGPTTFTINPNADFVAGELCTVTVVAAQVADQDPVDPPDAMAANHVFSFTTDVAPTVTGTTPVNGATSLGTTTNLTVTFSEPVNVTGNWFQIVCATSGTRNVADTVVTGGPTTFTIDPNADVVAGEVCTVTVLAAQITDQDAADPPDAMAANYVFSFTADVAPTVTATTPANGATDATTTANLTVTFSEPVTVTGNWLQIVCGTSGTRNVADTVVSGGPTAFTIDPNVDFAGGETCTVTIAAAQVADQDAGDPPDTLAANYVFAFTTDVAPSVTSTTPTTGATTTTTTNLTVTFSEPVNATGNWFQVVCATSGTRNVADTVVTGGPTTFAINPTVDFAGGETCTVTVFAAQVADQDAADPPDTLAADFVFNFTTDVAPSVTSTTPTNGAADLASTANLSVTFSEPVTVTGNWFQLVCTISGTRNVADTVVTGGPTTYTANPNVDFAAGETCTATIFAAQVTDQDATDPPDTMAANFVGSFTIDAAPSVTATTPTNGATQAAANANVSLTLSEPVNAAGGSFTIGCTSSGAHTFALSGGPTTWTLNPDTDFTAGETCTVTALAAGITDQDASDPPDAMTANYVFSFTIDVAPSVTATTPTNGAVQVGTTANITATFSEPVDVTGSAFTISCSVSGAHTATVSGGPTTFTLNPDTDFVSADLCTVTVVAAQVTDQDAIDPPDAMTANFVFSFTVDTAPSVTSTTPTNGATGVVPTTNITVNFSESVNATTGSFTLVCGGNAQAFALGASPAASFTLNPTADLPEGVFCTVTALAAGITDADAGDPPDNMLADYVFTFAIPPNANNDARGATGNVPINTATTGFSVLSNDVGPGIAVTAFDATSVLGGTVSVNGAGVFTYTPPVGYEGIDSFTYTITNAAGSDTAAVNVTVSGMLWFIDDSAAACTTIAGGCGRLSTPFSTLAAFNAVDGGSTTNGGDVVDPEAGDHVFIYSGTYAGGLTVENTQRIIGQGAGSSLVALSGITPAIDSIALPSTGGAKPSITTAGFTLAQNNQVHGIAFSGTSGAAIGSAANVGTLVMSDVTIANTTGGGISLTGGGTVTLTGAANTIVTTSGVALNVVNTNIGAAGLTFQSIAANGASSGIVLNNTGTSGGLTVTGDGGSTNNASGGTIQNTTGAGISLTQTRNVSLDQMSIQNTAGSGIDGRGVSIATAVTNFSFTNGTVNNSGTSGGAQLSNIAFNDQDGGSEVNLVGTFVVTGSVLTSGRYHGISAVNFGGTITSATIANNTLTSTTSTVTSLGSGIQVIAYGGADVTTATIDNNDITNFPSDAGIMVQGGNAAEGGDSGHLGDAGSGTNVIAITNNTIAGQSAVNRMGTQGILINVNGTGEGNFNVTGNAITNVVGNAISNNVFGDAVVTSTISTNTIVKGDSANTIATSGIVGGVGQTGGFTTNTPRWTATVTNNNISGTDGNGILLVAREDVVHDDTFEMTLRITNNTVAAPLGGTRPGIRVDAGNDVTDDNDVRLEIAGNTTGGSNGSAGIGVRRQGTDAAAPLDNEFGIEGLSPSPANETQTENHISSLNPNSALGTGALGGASRALVINGNNFTSAVVP